MSYGFQSINTDSIIQIDQDYSNYVIESSGTVSVSNSTSGQRIKPVIVGSTQLNKLVFFRLNTTSNIGWGRGYPESDPDSPWVFAYPNSGNFTIDWFTAIPASSQPLASSGYGLEVYTSSGALAYSSNYNYQNIQRIINAGIFPTSSSGSATYNFPAMPNGEKPYILTNGLNGTKGLFIGENFRFSWGPYVSQPSNTSITVSTGVLFQQLLPNVYLQIPVAVPYILVLAQLN